MGAQYRARKCVSWLEPQEAIVAETSYHTDAVPVVTARTLRDAETMATSGSEAAVDSSRQKTIARYNRALERLEGETRKASPDVLITVQDRDISVLQSRVAEGGEGGLPLLAGGLEAKFGIGITGGDLWGWARSVFDHIDQSKWHPIVRPPDDRTRVIADAGRIAVISDWGTNLYGAPVSAASITRTGGYELVLHLGDIYYSGTKTETKQRFLDVWPMRAGKLSRALNGNHEMYSGGFAYFDEILPTFGQPSSYFALRNTHWLLVGLDTAHTDHALDAQQVRWLKSVVHNAGEQRKVILFSHHQPFSRLGKQGPKLQVALGDLLRRNAIFAWYWGHEHNCVIYDEHEGFGLRGRCIGHGGIPSPRKTEVMEARTEKRLAGIAWKRLSANRDAPSCLVLDGPNPLIKNEEERFGPHGYLSLEINGPHLVERIHLPDGTKILEGQLT